MKKTMFGLMMLFCALMSQQTWAQVTFEGLLEEMVSRDAIASFPEPAYTNKQFSSHSRVANDPGNPETWFHNEDWSNFIRKEERDGRREFVMLDHQGPGAIVRFWMTFARGGHDGTLRIYIDGSDTPVIEGSVLKVLSGGQLVGPPLSSSSAEETDYLQRGHNLYLPIPYNKSCKVTFESDKLDANGKGAFVYYNINYRGYERGTEVQSFTKQTIAQHAAAIDKAQDTLARGGKNPGVERVDWSLQGKIAAGDKKSLMIEAAAKGGSIRHLAFKLEADDLPQALRSTILEMTFDGERTVWVPAGDFFGTGYQLRHAKFWYGSVQTDGLMQSHWVMPYEKSAQITVHNLGEQSVTLAKADVGIGGWEWDEQSMHFGANWHQLTGVMSGGSQNGHGGRGAYDMNYVTLKGKGVYAGDTLTLWDSAPQWWGEGDEKIYIDGEKMPSHFGTGTEDYYGYAWCIGNAFNTPFITQPDGTGDLGVGYVVNGRYRLLDGIPFNKSIRVDMEQYHWAKVHMDIAPTTYWYAQPGVKTNIEPEIEAATHKVALSNADVMPAPVLDENGRLEGEFLVIGEHNGEAAPQGLNGWSGGSQLWWRQGNIGDELELSFEADKKWAGKNRRIAMVLTEAVDYGEVEIRLNGKVLAKSIEGYTPELGRRDVQFKGEIVEGKNILTVKIIGVHPDAKPGQMFGLDVLQVK